MASKYRPKTDHSFESPDFAEALRKPEPLQYDETYCNLQRDYDSDAPEVIDAPNGAPITIIDSGLHPIPDASVVSKGSGEKQVIESHIQGNKTSKWHSRKSWVLAGLVITAVAALTVGLAVAFTRQNSSVANTTALPQPSPVPCSSPQAILNDTAFAAAQLDNGDKVVFFQDTKGQLNRVVYSGGSWASLALVNASLNNSAIPTPKINTPLSLLVRTQGQFFYVNLFYLSENNSIIQLLITKGNVFYSLPVTLPGSDQPAMLQTGSRAMSVTTYMTNDPLVTEDYLIFQNNQGNVSLWKRENNDRSPSRSDNSWEDISSSLDASASDSTFGVPFASCAKPDQTSASGGFGNETVLQATFFDPNATREQNLIMTVYNATSTAFDNNLLPFGPTDLTTQGTSLPLDPATVQRSDIVLTLASDQDSSETNLVGYWVNGTAAAVYTFDARAINPSLIPPVTFPFARMATLVGSNGTVPLYLYHQVNGTVFSQLFFDTSFQSWTITEIDVTILTVASGNSDAGR